MSKTTIYAHTPGHSPYPPYLNLRETLTGFVVTVRGSALQTEAGYPDAGHLAEIEISLGELAELHDAIGARLADVE